MYKRFIPVFAILIILVTVLSACGGTTEGEVQIVKETVIVEVEVEVPVEVPAEAAPVVEGILSRVLERTRPPDSRS
jgi:predicted small secreted protein